jgi:hypothetical protein
MRNTIIACAVIAVLSAASPAAEVDPPMQANVPLRRGGELKGKIKSFDEQAFEIEIGKDVESVRWDEVAPRAVFSLNERLLAEASAEQWFALGQTLRGMPHGATLADRAYVRAIRLDPSYKQKVAEAKAPKTPQPPPTTGPKYQTAWGSQTDEERAAAIVQLKEQQDKHLQAAGVKAKLRETKYFLLYSNLSDTEMTRWAAMADRMYDHLAALFGLEAGKNIWNGKAVVYTFAQPEEFIKFEKAVFGNNDAENKGGYCHPGDGGIVLITFYRALDDQRFAHSLVHESTHGFVHRYRSPEYLPSWANEGLAEVMAFELVPQEGARQDNTAKARAALREPDGIAGFFEKDPIENWQYPIARTLCDYMIRRDKQAYVKFINGIKDGTNWMESLRENYHTSPQQLIADFGKSLGVNDLRLPE